MIDGTTASATVSGFATGDHIVFSGLAYSAGATVSASASSVTIHDGASTITLDVAGGTSIPGYTLQDDGGVIELVPCYAAGTHILSTAGEILVEDIKPGDTLVTVREGGPLSAEVVWVGHRTIDISRHPNPELVRPVRILAGAIAPGIPERDLRLSPHHAVYLDGALFEARRLINGTTIYQEPQTRFVTYHHVELTTHDVILAEGLAAESFLDTGNRAMFANQTGPLTLHADFRPLSEDGFCVPLVHEGDILERMQTRLAQRAAKRRAA